MFFVVMTSGMIKIDLIFTFCILHFVIVTNGTRKIMGGEALHHHLSFDNFVAYLVKAPVSRQKYNAWLCGGAIVSHYYIVTSSACVEDVEYMYAVAGVKQYYRPQDILADINACARQRMKKVVMTCVPKSYELDYEDVKKWTNIDIAVVKVESPFDFGTSLGAGCDIIRSIDINYDPKYQKAEGDAQVYGWGHTLNWRAPGNNTDLNQVQLHYAPLLIQPKSVCYEAYKDYNLTNVISKYMLCLNSSGNIDHVGHIINIVRPALDGCITENEQLRGAAGKVCGKPYVDETRKYLHEEYLYTDASRRNGICQNDHGGPLVTYIGRTQYLIGVASVFKVTKSSKCEGPFLFTSTQCNGVFLDCVINEKERSTRSVCNKSPDVRGFAIKKRIISWADHPDGAAVNERIRK